MLHPWNQQVWQRTARHLDKLSHALLLGGPRGVGKDAFALHLAWALLCEAPSADGACGACRGCRLLAAGNHPDLFMAMPAEEGKGILIDQVRALSEFLPLRPHTAARKIALLTPAETMNMNAANSLLKSLEEPPAATHLLLVSHRPERLPATIRSRCARLDFIAPPREVASAWLCEQGVAPDDAACLLALVDDAPLRAVAGAAGGLLDRRLRFLEDLRALAEGRADPIACAGEWKKAGAQAALDWLRGLVADLARLASGSSTRLFNPDAKDFFDQYAKRSIISNLLDYFDVVSRNHDLARESLDEVLLLEDSLIQWAKLMRQS